MKILLRKASTLARACAQAAAKIEIKSSNRVSVHAIGVGSGVSTYAPVPAYLENLSTTTQTNLEDILALLRAKWTIRRLIGNANADRIDDLLAEKAALDEIEKQYNLLIGRKEERSYYRGDGSPVKVKHNEAEINHVLVGLRTRLSTSSATDVQDHIEIPTLSDTVIEALQQKVAAVQRRRSDLSDELAGINLTRFITLDDTTVAVLSKHGIIGPQD